MPHKVDEHPPLWKRTASFLIDLAIVHTFLITPFWGLIRKSLPGTTNEGMAYLAAHPQAAFSLNMVSLFVTLTVMAYFVILEHLIGSTVGMLILRLKVVSSDHHFHWWQCIVRNLFFIPIFPFFLFWIIEPISLLWTRGAFRTLERLSKTRLVEETIHHKPI